MPSTTRLKDLYFRRSRFTWRRIFARAESRCIQSTLTWPLNHFNKRVRNNTETGFSRCLTRTLVLGQGIIKGDLFIAKACLFASRTRRPNVLGDLNQLINDLGRRKCIDMVARNCRL